VACQFYGHVKLHHGENDDDRPAIQTLPRSCARVMGQVRQKGSQHLFSRPFVNRLLERGKKIQTNEMGLRPRPKPHGSRATDTPPMRSLNARSKVDKLTISSL
jgi:hypothetical protein